jgi:hypothetical protein
LLIRASKNVPRPQPGSKKVNDGSFQSQSIWLTTSLARSKLVGVSVLELCRIPIF